ncbi:MAG: sucrose synthase [Leptolyngbyaceae cyanobacterium MO_188.B28]|nr:sucrose synthase [Leptolyngbyaceae cyanobacterium MO_188.B28]
MHELLQAVLNSDEETSLHQLISELSASGKRYFLRNEILQTFEHYCTACQKPAYFYHSSSLGELIHYTHEILLEEDSIWFVVRSRVASQEICRLSADLSQVEPMTPQALLDLRDRLVDRFQPQILEIDFQPFSTSAPTIRDPRNIGNGLEFLNHYLSNKLIAEPQHWLEAVYKALYEQRYNGVQLLVNERIGSAAQLSRQIQQALQFLGRRSANAPYETFRFDLQELGFEPGWGNTARRIRETLELLQRLMENPNPAINEAFLSRIPVTFRCVLVSIHGWVGQEGVLGRPETAGQVRYVLDQARNLENQMQQEIKLSGLDVLGIQPQVIILTRLIPNCEGTQCNLPLEKVHGTENAWILRVPFREFNPNVTRNWISRYEIWPYLETFAIDAERQVLAQLEGPPNLIIGNYTDGGLVAFLLARRLKVPHCNIAHSLEKSKHVFSDLYWQDSEEQYHFSLQFTADLISMNAADFIITSSHHEIMGTPDAAGQYESYKCFTLPQLYHVVDGIDLFSPKFNVVPPGVNQHIYFPYSQMDDRAPGERDRLNDLLFVRQASNIRGDLDNPEKRPILAVGPINFVRNLTGLVECFGQSQALQARCNLVMITGNLNPEEASTPEEKREIQRLHDLIDTFDLQTKIRWVGQRLTSRDLGEAYRVIGDRAGLFVLPARFEAFGVTVLEAMVSGLPTFATQFGGPSEIIEPGKNGFHINPTNLEETAKKILDFIAQCDTQPDYWREISERGVQRVRDKYNWRLHIKQLLLFAKLHRFWRYASREDRDALFRYLEALFYLIYKPKAERLLEQHGNR